MAASLKLVANNPEITGYLNMPGFTASLHELPLNSGKESPVLLPVKTSYKVLTVVIASHLALIASIVHSQINPSLHKEQKTQPITVSLLSTPSPASEAKMETIKEAPVVQKNKPQPTPVNTKPLLTEKPATTSPEIEQKAIVDQTPAEPARAEASTASKSVEAAPTVAANQIKAAEQEPVVEPPKFGAAYLNNPAPKYPASSRRAGEQGRVLLKVLVSEQGTPEEIELDTSSGSERLDQAAMDAVKKWSFIPAKRSNQPVSAYVLVPVKFSLNS